MRIRLLAIIIDLGVPNTIISLAGKILVNEPSIWAIDAITNQLLASGSNAMMMYDKISAAEIMIKPFTNQIWRNSKNLIFSSFIMLSVPFGITNDRCKPNSGLTLIS